MKSVSIMKTINNIVIPGSRDKDITIDVTYEENGQAKPIIIFSHGFKGFKDWGHFNVVANEFAEAGFVFIKFNFSYNGTTTKKPTEFDDLEAFGNNNYTTELNDLEKVIDWAVTTELLNTEVDPSQVNLMGHSRGGGITILKACEDARVKKIVTWASVGDFVNTMKAYKVDEWKEKGVTYIPNARTNQEMPLYYQFYENTLSNTARLDIHKVVERLSIPLLIIHGTNDEVVSVKDANYLLEKCDSAEVLMVDGAGHAFGIKHPFEGDVLPETAEKVVSESISFFNTNY